MNPLLSTLQIPTSKEDLFQIAKTQQGMPPEEVQQHLDQLLQEGYAVEHSNGYFQLTCHTAVKGFNLNRPSHWKDLWDLYAPGHRSCLQDKPILLYANLFPLQDGQCKVVMDQSGKVSSMQFKGFQGPLEQLKGRRRAQFARLQPRGMPFIIPNLQARTLSDLHHGQHEVYKEVILSDRSRSKARLRAYVEVFAAGMPQEIPVLLDVMRDPEVPQNLLRYLLRLTYAWCLSPQWKDLHQAAPVPLPSGFKGPHIH